MRRNIVLAAWLFLLTTSLSGQSIKPEPINDINSEKLLLLADLQALEGTSVKLDQPVARALVKAEIAAAAWTLDQAWAKKLLREAYNLTFPDEEEQIEIRKRPVGAPLTIPTSGEIAQNRVRNRVLEIAGRDRTLTDELVQLGAERLGKEKENYMYTSLAARALAAGDQETAVQYIDKSFAADPTIINAGFVILDVAARDRAAADRLIMQYIERLRATPLSIATGSALRTYYLLKNLMFPNDSFVAMRNIILGSNLDVNSRQIPPAGAAVIKAYISYVIESMTGLERSEPGSARHLRGELLSTWLPLNQYAPELAGAFLELEKMSRRPGDDASLPEPGSEKAGRDNRYAERVRNALDKSQPDDLTINFAISRGDFVGARKMIDLLPDGKHKIQFTESVNTSEALSLAAGGDTLKAERVAEQLNDAISILQVYPLMISKCVAQRDSSCATVLLYRAMKQLRRAEDQASVPLSLTRLAKAVASVNDALALEALEEAVSTANRSNAIDTRQGPSGLDHDAFKRLAPKNEVRVRQAATALKDPSRQILALAAIYQWKAEELTKSAKAKTKR